MEEAGQSRRDSPACRIGTPRTGQMGFRMSLHLTRGQSRGFRRGSVPVGGITHHTPQTEVAAFSGMLKHQLKRNSERMGPHFTMRSAYHSGTSLRHRPPGHQRLGAKG